MFKLILQLHAHKKGTGSSHNGRDSKWARMLAWAVITPSMPRSQVWFVLVVMAVPNALSALSPWKLKKRKIFGNAKPRSVMERGFSYFMMQQPWRGRLHSAPLTRGACTDVVDCGFRQVSLTVRKFFSFTVASRPAGARCAYSVVPAPAADRRQILNSLLWGR